MLPEADKRDLKQAVAALCKRFRPADIEELRGLEFHHKMQAEDETIEQLGLTMQQLGRKAFSSITGKDFDRLLKGRFFQALHVKWQRKLGSLKPAETFYDLYDRARMIEHHEKQYTVSAATHPDGSKKGDRTPKHTSTGSSQKTDHSPSPKTTQQPAEPSTSGNSGSTQLRE